VLSALLVCQIDALILKNGAPLLMSIYLIMSLGVIEVSGERLPEMRSLLLSCPDFDERALTFSRDPPWFYLNG